MLKIKLIKLGNKNTSFYSIVSVDSKKKITKKSKKIGFIDRIWKKILIKKKILFDEIKKGVKFSYGFIKTVRAFKNIPFIKKYEIKIV